ncbi:MAG TPA: hypothetical protein VHL09_16355 [Dehalococcoidia bacterium]|nr:hypothetical protein [Dehalococcoidia bacterium]
MADQQAPGLLLAALDVPEEFDAEFNRIYDQEHVPQLLALPGFLNGRRFQAVEGKPRFQALYDLASPEAFAPPIYEQQGRLKNEWNEKVRPKIHTREVGVFRQILADPLGRNELPTGAGGVLLVGLSVAPEHEEEFHAWYNTEHIPFLAKVPGVLRARRFAPVDGSNKYLAVYDLANPDVPLTQEWNAARNTPWSARQRPRLGFWLRVRSKALVPARTS